MAKKKATEIVAVIDIGSNELRMKIAQSSSNKMKVIESLTYPLSLGKDTFDTGTISFEKMSKACDIIRNFLKVTAEYGVTRLRTVATTAVREAGNRDYFLDQIKIKTGMAVEVLDDSQEKLYIYKLITHLLDDDKKKFALMAYTGSGNVGVSVLTNGKIPFMQNIRIGSLRISEIFFEIQENTSEFYRVLEEYISSFTDVFEGQIPDGIECFIASGQGIEIIARLCGAEEKNGMYSIPITRLDEIYDEIKLRSVERVAIEYDIPNDKAEVLLPAMCIYRILSQLTCADKIMAVPVFLIESMLFEMLFPSEIERINKEYSRNAMLSAKSIASKYGASTEHYERVRKFSLAIFDKMKKIHGLGQKEKLLLNIAAVTHDIGKFISLTGHYLHSWHIINNSDIVGLSLREIEIVAFICLYHSRILPDISKYGYGNLNLDDRVLVSKLASILRIADSLDRSHELKFDSISVDLTSEELVINVETEKNIDLEKWSFNEKSGLFSEVFGIKSVLKKKRVTF